MADMLSPEDARTLLGTLNARFGGRLESEAFSVRGRAEPDFVELSVAIDRPEGDGRYAFDIRASLVENGISQDQGRDLVVDFLGYYLELYFEGGRELLLPLDFQPHQFGEHVVHARGDVTSPRLDAMADEIIASGVPLPPGDPRRGLKK